jgi:hypothetical protein
LTARLDCRRDIDIKRWVAAIKATPFAFISARTSHDLCA